MTKTVRASASLGLALGGILGLAGTFAPSDSLRGLAWGVDGLASPLPYFAYPVFVATLGAWIWALLTGRVAAASSADAV